MRFASLLIVLSLIRVGDRAPNAEVKTLDGKPVDLGSYVGKSPVVIEFWAKWCPNCRELEPKLSAARAHATGIQFVTVAASVDETPAEVDAYAKAHNLGLVLYDQTGAAVDAYDVPGTSFLVVIDKSGHVVYTGAGGDQDVDAALKLAR
jgi:peroxiredoxin